MYQKLQTTNMIHRQFHPQRGAILIISLIMLLVLTILGVTGMRTTVLEEKMAGNLRDKNIEPLLKVMIGRRSSIKEILH